MKKAFVLLPFALLFACTAPGNSSESMRTATSRSTSYDASSYTVTFESQGGSAVASATVEAGALCPRPEDPTKADFYFAGWCRDQWGVIAYYFDEPVSQNLTLYASWSDAPIESSSQPSMVAVTYTIEGMPTWVTNDGCVIFAWAWGGVDAGGGAWFNLEYTSKTSATFDVEDAIDGFLLARCAAGTTVPNWGDTESTGPGRVFNKTTDITTKKGVTTYQCSEWVEYPVKSEE